MVRHRGRPSACPVAAVSTDSGGCVHPVVYRAITEVPVASLLLRDVNSYTLPWGCSNTSTRKTTCGVTLPRCRDVCITDHHRLLAGSTLAVNGLTAGGVKG